MAHKPDNNSNRKNLESIRGVLSRLEQMAAVDPDAHETPAVQAGQPNAKTARTAEPPLRVARAEKLSPLANLSLERRLAATDAAGPFGANPADGALEQQQPPPAEPFAPQAAGLSLGQPREPDRPGQARPGLQSTTLDWPERLPPNAGSPASQPADRRAASAKRSPSMRAIAVVAACLATPVFGWVTYSMKSRMGFGVPGVETDAKLVRETKPDRPYVGPRVSPNPTTAVAPRLLVGNVAIRDEASTAFPIHVDLADGTSVDSVFVLIHGLPEGAQFSNGQPHAPGVWKLAPDQAIDLKLRMPSTAPASTRLNIELLSAQGTLITTETSTVVVQTRDVPLQREEPAQDPGPPSYDRIGAEARVAGYLARGQELLASGNVSSARAFFRRAADANSPQGALAMGATYDPNYFEKLGIQGMQADSNAARQWYEKAAELGSKDALDRLSALK